MTTWSHLDIPDTHFSVAALHAALDTERTRRGLTWMDVAREVNRAAERGTLPRAISASTISGLAKKVWGVEGDGALQMIIWLGRTPESFVAGHPGAELPEARLPLIDPPRLLRFNVPGIYEMLDVQRADREMTWRDVAREIGNFRVTPATLQGMRTQSRTGFPHIMLIARWLQRPCADLTHAASW